MKNFIFLLLNKFLKKIRFYSIRNSHIGKYVKINSGTQLYNVNFGDYSYCGYDCNINQTTIGKFCCLSDRIVIGGTAHPIHFVSMSSVFLSHKDSSQKKLGNLDYLPIVATEIGHDVWIGNGAIIKAGVHIGHGAVIGMGSVVTKDVPPYAIVGGNPAKVIRSRFDADLCDRLLQSRWWDLSEQELLKYSVLFNDPETFLKELKQ